MSPHPLNRQDLDDDTLLRPREVAAVFGVRTATIARWAREGRLTPLRTPGGHRRYRSIDVRKVLRGTEPDEDSGERDEDEDMVQDAVRLYGQGWSIRQVADQFECSYGVMRRILKGHVTLRTQGGLPQRDLTRHRVRGA
jgi:excisionase family DNA binding protein